MRTTIFLSLLMPLAAQPALEKQIAAIAADAQGTVHVACLLPGSKLRCDLNAKKRPPMQSVFKLPLVVTVLHQIDEGKLTLDQPIRFLKQDRILPKTYSPLQDKYPEADVDVPLRELMRLATTMSDNAATETLLRIAGGPPVVDAYIKGLNSKGFQLKDGEALMHRDDQAQYRNWWEPSSAVAFLMLLNDRSPLKPETSGILMTWLAETQTGPKRLKGNLPAGTVVQHKTGTSGIRGGVAAATNDIGLITLPNGRKLAIAVFVTDAKASEEVREGVIARIAKAAYDAAVK